MKLLLLSALCLTGCQNVSPETQAAFERIAIHAIDRAVQTSGK